MYLQIRTKANYQRYELDAVAKSIERVLAEAPTSFRSHEYLDSHNFVEFVREFSGIEIFDLSIIRARDGESLDDTLRDIVKIYRIVGENGRSLTTADDEIKKILDVGIRINKGD
ncbi:hypothetical protein D3C80_1863450 [compost metagenome]